MKRQLDDAGSPLRRFFGEHLANTKGVRGLWKESIGGAELLVPGKRGPADVIGQASSLTIAGALDRRLPGEVVLGVRCSARLGWVDPGVGASFLELLAAALEGHSPDLMPLSIVATWFEQIYRSGPRPNHPFGRLGPGATVSDLLALVDPAWADEVHEIDDVAVDALAPLRARAPIVAGATVDGSLDVGGADADLICGGTLVEIKSPATMSLRQRDIQQLVAYVLLDYTDTFAIEAAGFYMSRFGLLRTWSTDSLIVALAGRPMEIGDLRSKLAEALN